MGSMKIGLCTSTRWSPGTWQTTIGVPSGSCQWTARVNAETCIQLRCVGAATWWWRGEFSRWEGESQQKLQKRPLRLYIRLEITASTSGVPLPPARHTITIHSTYKARHGDRTNCIRPRRPVMSLSFPTLPEQPGLTARYSVFLYTSIHPAIFWYCWQYKYLVIGAWWTPTTSTKLSAPIGCRRYKIGDLGWGPRIRHLDLFLHVPLSLWGGNHATSRRPVGVYTHTYTYRAINGARAGKRH
jgi:hypothetical protein